MAKPKALTHQTNGNNCRIFDLVQIFPNVEKVDQTWFYWLIGIVSNIQGDKIDGCFPLFCRLLSL